MRLHVEIGLSLVLLGTGGAAAQDFADVEIQASRVAGNVYMLTGRGGNIGVSVGEDGILIVDDQFAPLAERIRAALAKLGGGEGKPKFILNTHWHGDHTGGNPVFGREGTILAHTNVRKRLSTRQERFGRVSEPLPKEGLPVITFDESLTVHFNGEEIRAIHFPRGHTDGDSVIFFTNSNVVHMGDDFFAGRFPFVDLASGGSVEGLIENVRKLLEMIPQDARIIPGHGPLSTKDDLRAYLEMLEETTRLVRERMARGQDLEAVEAAGLPERWASWASDFVPVERWIETIYRSYGGE